MRIRTRPRDHELPLVSLGAQPRRCSTPRSWTPEASFNATQLYEALQPAVLWTALDALGALGAEPDLPNATWRRDKPGSRWIARKSRQGRRQRPVGVRRSPHAGRRRSLGLGDRARPGASGSRAPIDHHDPAGD